MRVCVCVCNKGMKTNEEKECAARMSSKVHTHDYSLHFVAQTKALKKKITQERKKKSENLSTKLFQSGHSAQKSPSSKLNFILSDGWNIIHFPSVPCSPNTARRYAQTQHSRAHRIIPRIKISSCFFFSLNLF